MPIDYTHRDRNVGSGDPLDRGANAGLSQSPQTSAYTWDEVRAYISTSCTVEKEWPGEGFIFYVDGVVGRHRLLLAINNPGWGSVDYVTAEATLGIVEQVDLIRAAQAANTLLGDIVCSDGIVSLRDSRCLTTLSTDHLSAWIGYITGVVDAYTVA